MNIPDIDNIELRWKQALSSRNTALRYTSIALVDMTVLITYVRELEKHVQELRKDLNAFMGRENNE